MTTMRCPLGHPPGPQPFCPICGRATVPVEEGSGTAPEVTETVQPSQDWPGSPDPTGDADVDPDVEYGGSPASPTPPAPAQAPAAGPSWSDFQSDLPEGPAAVETKRLIDELQAGRPVTPPTFLQPPQAPGAASWGGGERASGEDEPPRHEAGGVFPRGEIPDYSPTPPGEPAPEPPSPPVPPVPPAPPVPSAPPVPTGPPVAGVPPFEMPPRNSVLDSFAEDPQDERAVRSGRSFGLLPLLLVVVVLVGAAYFVSTWLFGGGASTTTQNASTGSSAPTGATSPQPVQTYPAAQIAASLKDPHFKHGYDAGVLRKKAGPVEDARATCRSMGLSGRTNGYAWGAHDQQGCLVGITST